VDDETDQRQLLIVVKADVQGSVEAVCDAVARLSSDKVGHGCPFIEQLGYVCCHSSHVHWQSS
jgi:translation initiation factor IF-2